MQGVRRSPRTAPAQLGAASRIAETSAVADTNSRNRYRRAFPDEFSQRDRLKQLRSFCHAARLGSISRAAEYVFASQPAVSTQVRKLEDELGVLLFKRRGRRVALTRVGQSLYRLAMPLVQGMDRLPDAFAERHHGDVGGVLRIGAGQVSAAYVLPKYLKTFRERYPGVRIEIRAGTGEQRLDWLRDFEIDVVVAAMDVPPSDVEFHPIVSTDLVLITPLDHPLAGRDSVTGEELAAYPFVGHPPTRRTGFIMEVILRQHGCAPDLVIEVDGWGVITNYVAAGVGIAFVPELCLTEHDRLWRIPLRGAVPRRMYGTVTRRDGLLASAARQFVRTAVPELSDTPVER